MRNPNVTLQCEVCGDLFHPQWGRETEQHYCSRKCYLHKRWGNTPRNRCKQCGCDISHSGKRSQVFCSFGCRITWQRGKPRKRALIRYGKGGRYRARRLPDHPGADRHGYVMEHRLVMERHIGRFLVVDEVVHHIDGNSANNTIHNLQLMLKTEHDSLHSRRRWAARKTATSLVQAV